MLITNLLTACVPFNAGDPVDLPPDLPVDVSPDSDPALVEPVASLTQAIVREQRLPGLAVALVDGGELVYAAGFGWADIENARALDHTTPVLLSSVSKTFVGLAAMQAVEAGRLDLDDPVGDLLGYPVTHPRRDEAPTVRHLLTHHGAISDTLEYGRNYAEGDPAIALEDFCAGYLVPGGDHYRRGSWASRDVGEAFEYSNVGMACVGAAIGAAADVSFAELLDRDVLGPLGLDDSAYYLASLATPPAVPYAPAGDRVRPWPQYGYPTYPDGMMRMSARDVGRYLAMLAAGGELDGTRVLSAANVEAMITVDPSLGTDEDGQAIAFAMRRLDDTETVGHNGGDYGSSAELWFDPATGDGFALIANGNPQSFSAIIDYERSLMALLE